MSSLELYIGKSKYIIDCHEQEKEKIRKLAQKINERVNDLSLKIRGADEKTILMLSSIMIEEELESLKNTKKSDNSDLVHFAQEKSLEDIDKVSFFVETLANKIKNG